MQAPKPWLRHCTQLRSRRVSSSIKIQHAILQLPIQQVSRLSTCHNHRLRVPRAQTYIHHRSNRSISSAPELPRVLINDLRSQEIVVEFNDGRAIRYPSIWLRDHCPCPECTHQSTSQRKLETFHLNLDVKATDAEPTSSGLEVAWSDPDHKSTYPWSWLEQHEPFSAKTRTAHARSGWQHIAPTSPDMPSVEFDAVMTTDKGLAALLSQIRTFGFASISNTPPTAEASEKLLKHITVTHSHSSTASYTDTDTDTCQSPTSQHTFSTFSSHPPGLQLLHVLESKNTSPQTLNLTDGFAAAQHLSKLAPPYYSMLSQIPIISQSSTISNTSMTPVGHGVFSHATPLQPALYKPANLTQIRWNNAERHSSTVWPSHQSMQTWYAAAKAWSQIIASRDFVVEMSLGPGTMVVWDNWRVLHGWNKDLAGVWTGFVGMDEFLARGREVDARMLRKEVEDGQGP